MGENVGSKKVLGPTKFRSNRLLVQQNFGSKKLWLKKLRPQNIWPVATEIFLIIWTNVPRANVAWSNVTVTVHIC